jgi:hypothetical protein
MGTTVGMPRPGRREALRRYLRECERKRQLDEKRRRQEELRRRAAWVIAAMGTTIAILLATAGGKSWGI